MPPTELPLINVMIVDDHAIVCLGIRRLLEDIGGIKVIAEANSGEELLRKIKDTHPDVVLLDVNMPGIGGIEATRRINRSYPDVKVIAITAFQEEPFPSRVLQAGAAGYLTKGCTLDEMVDAIKKVHSGQRYITPDVAQQLALKSLSDTPGDTSPFDLLSERELQVMFMITSGLRVQEISERLCLSPKTVNSYRYRLFEKLELKNDVELTHLAIRYNLLEKNLFQKESAVDDE